MTPDEQKSAIDMLVEILPEIWEDRVEPKDRHIVMAQYCKVQGWVNRDTSSATLNLCNDPECGSCRLWDKSIKEAFNDSKAID